MGELIVKYGNEVNRAARRLTTSELRILLDKEMHQFHPLLAKFLLVFY